MTSVQNISNNQTFTNNIKKNQFQTSEIGNIFPAKKSAPEVEPETEAKTEIKTKEDVAKATNLDPSFIDALTDFEGLKLEQYKDGGGVRTIGYGHNIDHDPNYKYGKKITPEQANELLAADIKKAQKDLKECIGDVELTKGQNEALVDMFYNVGIEKLQNTNLIKAIKEKRFDDAVCEFNFICVKGNPDPCLCRRRIDDIERFCSGKHTQKSVETIELIAKKGTVAFDKKIKSANVAQKVIYTAQKNVYTQSTNKSIINAKKIAKEMGLREMDPASPIKPIEKLIPNPFAGHLILK